MTTTPTIDFSQLAKKAATSPQHEHDICDKCHEHMLDCECEDTDHE